MILQKETPLFPKTKKIRHIDPESKREKILDTSLSLFVEKGYHRVSIPNIVEASGTSTGAIYNLFGNKENIALTLHQQLIEKFMHSFQGRLQNCTTTYAKLRAFSEVIYEQTETDPNCVEYMFFMRHCEFIPEVSPICMTEPFRVLREIIRDGMNCGDVRPGDFFTSAVSYTGAILRPVQLHLECMLPKPLMESAEDFYENAWAAIKA
ncbi:transcriptional regulator, TetR family [Desulfuromusa kysingii]|uniref:Transcriptional regulator, TetR family n=1 Tax=Desulfuromusa kysingii TaxID=37625 RepID=A0A1H4BNK5_9BACT|nr:TetR/AcrR family transcriptional regulator [Desulfuromusa kysingii]SEA49634.1 transcriptional regulator, TetR family [Desulfuromusa kysingii]